MKKVLVARHFINNEATLEEFQSGVKNIHEAMSISSNRGFGFDLGLKLTVDTTKVDGQLQNMIGRELNTLEQVWITYDPVDRGPGTSFQQVIFNPSFMVEPHIVINSDLDQYRIGDEDSLGRLDEMANRMERDGLLYGVGSRDVPVRLAVHDRNSSLRIIHELFHSQSIGSDKLRVSETNEHVTPAYGIIGESTT